MARLASSLPLLWLIMLVPGIGVVRGLVPGNAYYAEMMQVSGLWSIYLLVLTLSVTPAVLALGRLGIGRAVARWLMKRRRHFGLGSFAYGALHLVHYLVEEASVTVVLHQAIRWDYASGWLAFAVMAMLAASSNQRAVRRLGRRWKVVHRWVYVAAGAAFLHWALFEYWFAVVAPWLVALLGAKAVHLALRYGPRRSAV
ncbi:MAG: ferric reductase-like transmembrane domain-containing protein [Pseudomonadota bacterium]